MVILHLTEVLPAPIPFKRHENDALLVSIEHYTRLYPDSLHILVLVVPYIGFLGSLFSKRRKQYRLLRRQKEYTERGFKILVLGVPASGYNFTFLRPLLDAISWWQHRKKLTQLLTGYRVTLVHAHNVYNTANLARCIKGSLNIPYVVTTRNIAQFFNSPAIKKNLRHASALISLNHAHKVMAEQLAPAQPSFLLPHGIDRSFFKYADIKTTTNVSSKAIRLVSICRLIPLKNIEKILYALHRVDLDFTYDIYGEGPELMRLTRICETLALQDRVSFMGHLDHSQVPETLSSYDIFILPSFPETLGRVFFEAMSLGLPVIAAKQSGIEGYIEQGVSGFLVDHEIEKELDNALTLLLKKDLLRESVGKAAKDIALQFSWDAIIKQLHLVYEASIDSNTRS